MSAGHDPEQDDIPDLVVAIDGPSGSGKSTVARALAKALGYRYLDTGAMYRAVTWRLLQEQVPLDAADDQLEAWLERLELEFQPDERVFVGGQEVTTAIRSRDVEAAVSTVSARPVVRRAMRELQRDLARKGPVVAEGRDIATVVFPQARWKFYLDADSTERARRRLQDFQARGRDVSLEDVLAELQQRDERDSSREAAPLKRSQDAEYVDTTGKSVEQVIQKLRDLVSGDD